MKNHYPGLLPKAHQWADIAFLNISFFVAYWFRFKNENVFFEHQYINLLLVGNLAWIFIISCGVL